MDRRKFIGGVGTNLLAVPLVALGKPLAQATHPSIKAAAAPLIVSDLGVTLDFGGGRVATFLGATAMDRGDFIGEFVRQKCCLATDPKFPDWRVWFRVDADVAGNRILSPHTGWRDEVIVEYGRSKTGTPANLTTSYTATITRNGSIVYSVTVPRHYWLARWRWSQNAGGTNQPRPVVRSIATLKSCNWIPNFTAKASANVTPYAATVTWPGPMQNPTDPNGSYQLGMADGGDHQMIGLLTEYAAQYAIYGNANLLTSVLTEGEWTSTWPMYYRDDATGNAFDFIGQKWRADGGFVNNPPPTASTEVGMEGAHMYCAANLPWLLTDDPFFLEALQSVVMWQGLWGAASTSFARRTQTRTWAWALRDLFLTTATTPVNTPSWLHNKAYYQSLLTTYKKVSLKFVDVAHGGTGTSRLATIFRAWTETAFEGPWQTAWLNAVVGQGVLMGFSDWSQIFAWGVDAHIQMTNGTSGWPRQWPQPYYMFWSRTIGLGSLTVEEYYPLTGSQLTAALNGLCTSWADLWAFYSSGGGTANGGVAGTSSDESGYIGNTYVDSYVGGPQSSWDTTTLYQKYPASNGKIITSVTNFQGLRAVLAIAQTNGIAGASACFSWIDAKMTELLAYKHVKSAYARMAVDPYTGAGGCRALGAATLNVDGLWWNSPGGSESGWGMNFAHQGDIVFATWFTYDLTGKAWWLSMTATETGPNTYTGIINETHGPAFYSTPFSPSLVTATPVGSGTLTFTDASNGTFSYTVKGSAQTKAIAREVFANPAPTCNFSTAADPALATNYQDLWWAYPPGSESGWGINLTHQGDIIFATWLTYDFDGSPLWLSVVATKISSGLYAGILNRTTGPAFNAVPFDPSAITVAAVGTARFTFVDAATGYFDYMCNGVSQAKRITRTVFNTPTTICV